MPAFQQAFCFLLSIILVKCQQSESFYFFGFDEQPSDWIENNGTLYLSDSSLHDPIKWVLSSSCPRYTMGFRETTDLLCVHVFADSDISRVISTVGYHSIQLKIDVNPWDLENSNERCYIQYRTASTDWINRDIFKTQGSTIHDTPVLGFEVSIPDTTDYNNQLSFEVKVGISSGGGGDSCLFDNLELIGVPYTPNPTTKPTTNAPTSRPTNIPSSAPMTFPTNAPSSKSPTGAPTLFPSDAPSSKSPTNVPTFYPSSAPTFYPSSGSTSFPTKAPLSAPTLHTNVPTMSPTKHPTLMPTHSPSKLTANPSAASSRPSLNPVMTTYHDTVSPFADTTDKSITPVPFVSKEQSLLILAAVLGGLIIVVVLCIFIISIKLKKQKAKGDAPDKPIQIMEGLNPSPQLQIVGVTDEGIGVPNEMHMEDTNNMDTTVGNEVVEGGMNNPNIADDEFIIEEDHETARGALSTTDR